MVSLGHTPQWKDSSLLQHPFIGSVEGKIHRKPCFFWPSNIRVSCKSYHHHPSSNSMIFGLRHFRRLWKLVATRPWNSKKDCSSNWTRLTQVNKTAAILPPSFHDKKKHQGSMESPHGHAYPSRAWPRLGGLALGVRAGNELASSWHLSNERPRSWIPKNTLW